MKDENNIPDNNQENGDLPPFLKDLKGNDPFKVPDGYFDELPGKIRSKIEQQEMNKGGAKVRTMQPFLAMSLIAAAVALIVMFYFIRRSDDLNIHKSDLALNTLDNKAIQDYLLNTANIDEDAIVDEMVSTDDTIPGLSSRNLPAEARDTIPAIRERIHPIPGDTTITRDDIIQYLLDEDFDYDNDI